MKFIKTDIPALVIIEPTVFGDARGYFLEFYNKKAFEENVSVIDRIADKKIIHKNKAARHKSRLNTAIKSM